MAKGLSLERLARIFGTGASSSTGTTRRGQYELFMIHEMMTITIPMTAHTANPPKMALRRAVDSIDDSVWIQRKLNVEHVVTVRNVEHVVSVRCLTPVHVGGILSDFGVGFHFTCSFSIQLLHHKSVSEIE